MLSTILLLIIGIIWNVSLLHNFVEKYDVIDNKIGRMIIVGSIFTPYLTVAIYSIWYLSTAPMNLIEWIKEGN